MIFLEQGISILIYNGIDAYMENRIYRDFQRFGLQVSYKFNATKSKYKGTGAGQSEKNRL